jgi:hypothetical protein
VLPAGPGRALLRMWAEVDDPRDTAGELAWRVEHWRLLNGAEAPFDPAEFRALEERVMAHAGTPRPATAHARMDTDGLVRGAETGRGHRAGAGDRGPRRSRPRL